MTNRLTQGRGAIRNLNLTDLAFVAMVTSIMALYDLKRLAVILQGVFLLCVVVELLKRRTPLFDSRIRTLYVISYAAFFLWAALSFLWAEHKSTFVQMLISIAQVSVIGIGTAYYINSRERLRFVFFALALAALVFCVRFVLDVPISLWGQRVRIGKALSYGGNRGPVMLSYVSLVLVFFAITKKKLLLYLPIALFMFIALLFGTRKVLVFFFVGVLVLLAARALTRRQFAYSVIGLLVVTGMLFFLIMNVDILYNSIGRRIVSVGDTLSERGFAFEEQAIPITEVPLTEEVSTSITEVPLTEEVSTSINASVQPSETVQPLPQSQAEAQPTTQVIERSVGSANHRMDLILMSVDIFKGSPLHGIGLDGFRFISAPYFGYTHSNQLELLTTLGIAGFLLYYWFQVYMAVWAWWRRRESHLYLLAIAFLAALFVDDFLAVTFTSEPEHICLGIMVGIMSLNTRNGAMKNPATDRKQEVSGDA